MTNVYKFRDFNMSGLIGISDKTLEMHSKLYQGYVKATNELTERIAEIVGGGSVDHQDLPAYSELKRRLGFEYNGMVLHEYYFDNLKGGGSDEPTRGLFHRLAGRSFQTFEIWKADFISVGKMRGVGWAICYRDPATGFISNHWVSLHETGNVSGFEPILVMDVWEHAYLLDYQPSERAKYIEAFFANIDWDTVEKRLKVGVASRATGHSDNRKP